MADIIQPEPFMPDTYLQGRKVGIVGHYQQGGKPEEEKDPEEVLQGLSFKFLGLSSGIFSPQITLIYTD
jgi:hypothetical protein